MVVEPPLKRDPPKRRKAEPSRTDSKSRNSRVPPQAEVKTGSMTRVLPIRASERLMFVQCTDVRIQIASALGIWLPYKEKGMICDHWLTSIRQADFSPSWKFALMRVALGQTRDENPGFSIRRLPHRKPARVRRLKVRAQRRVAATSKRRTPLPRGHREFGARAFVDDSPWEEDDEDGEPLSNRRHREIHHKHLKCVENFKYVIEVYQTLGVSLAEYKKSLFAVNYKSSRDQLCPEDERSYVLLDKYRRQGIDPCVAAVTLFYLVDQNDPRGRKKIKAKPSFIKDWDSAY